MENYCYIDDALKSTFDPSRYRKNATPSETQSFYKDADQYSEKLYADLLKVYAHIGVTKCAQNDCALQYNDSILGSDYIGPSRAWASQYLTDLEIGQYLRKTRVLGGHILWPRFVGGINQSRGGKKGYYDRIDCTLFELKLWYTGQDADHKLQKAFDRSRNWLITDRIKTFEDFIKTFSLTGYVDQNYNVYDLTTFQDQTMQPLRETALASPFIDTREKYLNYVNSSIYLINRRTAEMYAII